MASRREVRRCALQCLYQFESGVNAPPESAWASPEPGDAATDPEAGRQGFDLATLAWEFRADADAAIAPLTPEWPLHRQPVVDRNVLRLAHHEIVRGGVPARVAINEAVELAKEFGGEKSPAFVNGVLDRLFRATLDAEGTPIDTPKPQDPPSPSPES